MKTKRNKLFLVFTAIALIVAVYGFVPLPDRANAIDSIKDAKDTISDSDPGATATHVFSFTTGTSTPSGGTLEVTFSSSDWGTIPSTGDITCPGGGVASLAGGNRTAVCTYAGGTASGTKQITITNIVSPATTTTYYIQIYNKSTTETLERVTVAVAIIDNVLMTARVDSTLTFTISGTSTGATVHGVPCSNDSTATSTPFGTLTVGATSTVCQTLNVTTNADDGFTVTVEQNHELLSDSGSNINSFNNSADDTGSTTPAAWASPNNTLDLYYTYGHMGLFSDDSDLESGTTYADFDTGGNTLFAGLNSTDPMPIFHHNGPSDGATQNKGVAHILYQAEIGSLQEAGDYESTLTYICTPTF